MLSCCFQCKKTAFYQNMQCENKRLRFIKEVEISGINVTWKKSQAMFRW